ncbi:MAG: hypothetical protein MUC29_01805, partial [Pyrinomonadaceae bacterium]|nr:hypothetical protein [Pyrinomonadaceae bacterium]
MNKTALPKVVSAVSAVLGRGYVALLGKGNITNIGVSMQSLTRHPDRMNINLARNRKICVTSADDFVSSS